MIASEPKIAPVGIMNAFEKQDFSFDADFSKVIREKATQKIKELDFPTSKTEYWKYTRINKIVRASFRTVYPESIADVNLSAPSKNCLVFINGYFMADLSWTEAKDRIHISSLSEAKNNSASLQEKFDSLTKQDEIFAQINTAYHQDGAFIHLERNAILEDPIYVFHITDGSDVMATPRNFIHLEEGSQAKVVIKTISTNTSERCLVNLLSEVFVEKNAHLEINKIQDEGNYKYQIATEQVRQEGNSYFKINTFTLSGELVRNNLNISLNGEHTETFLNGLYPLKGKQHVDNHTYVLHREPNCVSHELYKGILDDTSTAVFNGKVYVHQDAQKTNAYQSNANIVLTDTASINSKPELEIYADDVKCSHGSTTGQLDEEALFYLRARGLSKKTAKAVLVNAFAADVIEHIGIEAVRNEIETYIDNNYKGIA